MKTNCSPPWLRISYLASPVSLMIVLLLSFAFNEIVLKICLAGLILFSLGINAIARKLTNSYRSILLDCYCVKYLNIGELNRNAFEDLAIDNITLSKTIRDRSRTFLWSRIERVKSKDNKVRFIGVLLGLLEIRSFVSELQYRENLRQVEFQRVELMSKWGVKY